MIIEFKGKDQFGPDEWIPVTTDIPFDDLNVYYYNIRINGKIYSTLEDLGFREEFEKARAWMILHEN